MKPVRLSWLVLLAGATAVLLSCGDPDPTGVDAGVSGPQASVGGVAKGPASRNAVQKVAQNTGLLRCTEGAYASDRETVGPQGGKIDAGSAVLWIPPGALPDTVTITLEALSDTVRAVRLRPEGLVFQQPAYLVMSYESCQKPKGNATRRIAYTSDSWQILEYQQSWDIRESKKVIGELSHFSNYAVAW